MKKSLLFGVIVILNSMHKKIKQKLKLGVLTSLIVSLFFGGALIVFNTASVSAAKKTGSALEKQANDRCAKDSEGKKDMNGCVASYKGAYERGKVTAGQCQPIANPNGGGSFYSPGCAPGARMGAEDAKKDGSNDENTSNDVCQSDQGAGASQRAEEACKAGYAGAAANKTKEDSCSAYTDQERKTACEAGYTAKKSGARNPVLSSYTGGSTDEADQADCDAKANSPLSWIICPIIDSGINMSDWAFKSLIEPLLKDVPISSKSNDGAFIAWQTFRIFGNIILVGALLIMVFAQNFGRFVDAYTVRKMAPRIVIGAIAINISYYLCLAAVDITNIVGHGLAQLLVSPFANGFDPSSKGITVEANFENTLSAGALTVIGLIAAPAMWAALAAAATNIIGVIWLLLPFILTITMLVLAVVFTLVVRMALIIFLTVVSGVAIALFILPGTEQYFRRWWDLFVKTLIMYPIIAALFAMSNIITIIMLSSAQKVGDSIGLAQILAAAVAAFAPIALIPFSFKFAGGALAAVMKASQGLGSNFANTISNSGGVKQRRAMAGQDISNVRTQRRAAWADSLKGLGTERDGQGAFRRRVGNRAFRAAAGVTGGYNIEAAASARRAETAKILNDQIATGRDEEIIGLTVDKRRIDRLRQQGIGQGEEWQYGDDGQLQYRSLNGSWVDGAHVDAGQARWGNDQYAQQAALSYAMRKADTTEKAGRVKAGYESLATGQWGMNRGVASGTLKGAGFENQGQHLQFKHMNLDGSVDHNAMVQEIYENKGSYGLSQMSSDNMQELVLAADPNSGISDTAREQLGSISETFMRDMATGRGGQVGAVGDDQQPLFDPGQPAGGQGSERVFGGSGAGSVNEKAYELARRTGRLANPPDENQHWQRPDSRQQ